MNDHEYEVGLHYTELDTPALLLDLPTMEANLEQMAGYFRDSEVNLRPHVKLHKATPILAYRQLEAGAIGLTCAKLSEAEVLAAAGIKDILIANQIVGARKIQRLVNLAAYTNVIVAVDDEENVQDLSRAAQARNVQLRVLVEVDIGNARCGVEPCGPALELSKTVHQSPGLIYMGLMGYDGHLTFQVASQDRERLAIEANTLLVETRRYIESAGLEIPIVSASGTFTYKYVAKLKGITEIQAGTYLLMDTAFREKGVTEFGCALSVLSTVISRPRRPGAEDLAVIDVGRKGIEIFYGFPEVKHPAGAMLFSMPQEHGRLRLDGSANDLKAGDKVELWVRDANGTVNLYDKFYAIRDGIVEAVWDIPGRGKAT
jgi:D-serine deaminase-like pyridoxal phosphate-dependent protein